MKKENKVMIHSVLSALQERDPEWEHPKMVKHLKTLFDSWRQKELRAKIHAASFYTLSWRRGWLPQADFVRFRNYVMQ